MPFGTYTLGGLLPISESVGNRCSAVWSCRQAARGCSCP